ncbi:chemotaxis protein CheW [bacterium]|nr:chemotaxis protein CheW [bacterium]
MSKTPAKRTSDKQVDVVQKLLSRIGEAQDDTEDLVVQEVEETLEALVFQLDREKYGIPIEHVLEIIRFVEATEVPHTVSFLDGIISLRGEMIPVINGRKRLGHEPKTPDKRTRTIVLQVGSNRYGIVVDAATQVVHLQKKNIEPTPPVVVGIDAEFIEGVCEHKGQLIILLNLKRFLEFA